MVGAATAGAVAAEAGVAGKLALVQTVCAVNPDAIVAGVPESPLVADGTPFVLRIPVTTALAATADPKDVADV